MLAVLGQTSIIGLGDGIRRMATPAATRTLPISVLLEKGAGDHILVSPFPFRAGVSPRRSTRKVVRTAGFRWRPPIRRESPDILVTLRRREQTGPRTARL